MKIDGFSMEIECDSDSMSGTKSSGALQFVTPLQRQLLRLVRWKSPEEALHAEVEDGAKMCLEKP